MSNNNIYIITEKDLLEYEEYVKTMRGFKTVIRCYFCDGEVLSYRPHFPKKFCSFAIHDTSKIETCCESCFPILNCKTKFYPDNYLKMSEF